MSLVEQTNYTFWGGMGEARELVVCNGDRTRSCFKLDYFQMLCDNDQKPKVLQIQKKKKTIRTRTHGSFLNQELDNTSPNPL